jgi:hypothetical protein
VPDIPPAFISVVDSAETNAGATAAGGRRERRDGPVGSTREHGTRHDRTVTLNIRTVLEAHGPATAIELTDAQVDELGGGKRAAVRVTVGDRSARLRLGVMGGRNLIGLSKASRAELGVEIGDAVDAAIELDAAEREVEIPDDLAAALDADPRVRAAFDALAFTHRKEHVRAVTEAKQAATRERRIAATVEKVRASLA